MRLCLIASKPTDSVILGFLPAAARLGLEVILLTDTPKDVLARDVQAPGLRAADLVAFGMAGAYAWNISHHGFLMHPEPGFHYVGTG